MEKKQEMEWEAAQSSEINVDLVSAAKRHLKFLAAVDRNRCLYEGPALDRAIYRYNVHWLPLLAKHSESKLVEGPLVAPLDCEWIWHCHRLNPVRYRKDCEEFYGRILDNKNVISSFEGISSKPTEDVWKTLFPGEPYELDLEHVREDNLSSEGDVGENFTKYDLTSAVQRQRPFFYQVSRLHLSDTRYIEGAVARYKGFLHLIKRNKERGIKGCCVPTYDIDLIWHTHQLHPVSYGEDLVKIMGNILEHDDTDSDRTKGQKLDVGFTGTFKAFENIYGRRYMRAGALFKGNPPTPVRLTPYSGTITKKVPSVNESTKVAPPAIKVFEVMLEFTGVRNLPEGHNGSLSVAFSKTQPDKIFNTKRTLSILSESTEKQAATFQCQPTGHLLFELMSSALTESSKMMGTASICLEDFLSPDSNLTVEKWLDLVPSSNIMLSKPIGLRVAISVTVPIPAPYTLYMVRSQPFSKNSGSSPPQTTRVQLSKNWTSVVNEDGNKVLNLQMRDLQKSKGKKICRRKVVLGLTNSGKICPLAEFAGFKWSMTNSPWTLKFPDTNNDDGHLLEMNGPHTVRLFPGGRLDYESSRCEKHKAESEHEPHLITAVKFSAEEPYGTAVALLDMKSGTVKVKEEWFVLPGLVVTLILGNILRKTLGGEKENGLVSAKGGACATAIEAGGCENMGKSGVSGGSCWGNGGSCWGSDVSGGGCWGSAGTGVSSGTCWGSAKGGSCWGNGVSSGTCWGSANGGSCWGNGVSSGTCWGSANGGSCWGNGVASGTCWGSANGGSCWGNGVTSGTCWGSANGGSCWGNGIASGTCWGSANGGSCWGNGVSSGTCWGSANGGSCWGNGNTGGGCWGSANGGSCWGSGGSMTNHGVKGAGCWGSVGMSQPNQEIAVAS